MSCRSRPLPRTRLLGSLLIIGFLIGVYGHMSRVAHADPVGIAVIAAVSLYRAGQSRVQTLTSVAGSEDRDVPHLDLAAVRAALEPRDAPVDQRPQRLEQLAQRLGQAHAQLVGHQCQQLLDQLCQRVGAACSGSLPRGISQPRGGTVPS